MALPTSSQDFLNLHQDHRQLKRPISSLSFNQHSSLFDEFDSYEESAMISPSVGASRRDSIAASTHTAAPLFSPAQSSFWDEDYNTTAQPPSSHFNNLPQHSNNPFRNNMANPNPFVQQSSAWHSFDHQNQASIAPSTYEPYSADFGSMPTSQFPPVVGGNPFSTASVQTSVRPAAIFPAAAQPIVQSGLSPISNKDWMSMAEQNADPRPLPKRLRQNSPPRGLSPFGKRPGDGIRKKLARVEIPPERNLLTIDQMIANSSNDDEIKELKSQKRLLRNRQAALDSRQRKKKQYEEAQEEKKASNERSNYLEDQVINLQVALDEKEHMLNELYARLQNLEMEKENLVFEKEQLMQEKTLETGELRQKVNILTERLHDAQSRSKNPSSVTTDFNDFTSSMDDLSMDTDYDPYSYINEFVIDTDTKPVSNAVVQHKTQLKEEDKPVAASGVLLMLLLCGAFVASKSSGTSAPALPKMPEEVRAASAVVLDSVFKDAGVAPSHMMSDVPFAGMPNTGVGNPFHTHAVSTSWPQPSHSAASSMQTGNPSDFNVYNLGMIQPTKEQEAEQAFSLSASSYLSMTTDVDDGGAVSSPPASHNRRNLAQSLKAMREGSKGAGAAEVFTRSLLWDRVPTEVVKEFKKLVEASHVAT